ncbi:MULTISPECIES: efflux RND transporter periplasmic adaptor subunit [Flavobacteriaceae]|uniref:Efflux RND transporter periplasmic adaptor subunit n=2 Tax=Flavobacteriaceae TaxID=49546 RepID=A0A4Y8ATU2_9FLAO|nr:MULTISPECIES: efflux RND transporter periplasmic adaptor subunit [Flavobacteriaceae]TEW74096.1 efflux RND transporter periplasmic adaptor subunit [Gramella jeungdoensis]GGK40207.1 hemolysin D [Lutibacter litoralis]
MKKIFKYTIATLSVVFFISCKDNKPQQQQARGPIPFAVKAVEIEDAVVNQEYSVNLEGQQNVEIRPKVNGFIQKIYVDEGQLVKKGQLLFKLETQSLSQDAAAAKARINVAQVEVDRLIPLVERNIISKVQLETAKANLTQAKSNYSSIIATINYATITSPVNGVIGGLPYREGSLVGSTIAAPLTTVSDTKKVRAYFSMNEKELLNFSRTFTGQTMQEKINKIPEVSLVLIDDSNYQHKGKIETISGLINQRTGSTECRAIFSNPEGVLRSGGSGTIKIPFIEKNIILIPQIAVFEIQGKYHVYVVGDNNKVSSRVVEVKGTSELNYIVSSGLKEGELVVIEGVSKLAQGQEISPKK